MKKLFIIYLLFFFNFIFSQKIYLKGINISNTEALAKYLANKINTTYNEKDVATYYDNLFRISMINENYDLSLSQLESVRNVYKSSDPTIATAMGSQFEIYVNTIKRLNNNNEFNKIYEEEFRKKYITLPVKSQIILPQYFNFNAEVTEKDIKEILTKKIKNDSIEIEDAIQFCRKYNTRNVANKSFEIAASLLKKLDKENFTIYDSVKISTKTNGDLTLSVILFNKNLKPENTILINTIYSDKTNLNLARQYASEGYACVILNTRGKYLSSNSIEPFEHEVNDINDAIDWIIKQPWSNKKVGMIGGSYLGFSQWAATKNIHPSLKTIIPQAPVGIGAMDFPMNNNIFTSYALRWLNYVTNNKMTDYSGFNEKKWNPLYKKWYQSGLSFNKLDSLSGKENTIFQRWLTHPNSDKYWQNMIPYKKEFSKINIPILTITGYYDSDQLGALYYLKEHYKYNKNAEHYLIIGPYDHSGAQGNIKNELRGYNIDEAANIDLSKICIEWFDHILKEKEKPSILKDKINYQVMGADLWKSTNSIDNFNNFKIKFYLENVDHKLNLSTSKNKDTNFSSLKVDFTDRTDADELLALKYDVIEKSLYNKNNLIFSTDTFEKAVEFSGNFSGLLKFTVNKKDCDIYANLYELMPNGKYFLLSTYLGRASYTKNSEKRNLLTPNKKETVSIYNNEFVSRKIEKGSKLVLVLGINKSPLWQVNYGTGKDVSEETIADAKEPLEIKWYNDSYIEIPVMEQSSENSN
ncbi:CocE/NonD family hydrolase [Chryseobacterium sp. PS-8]|uniref:CocE/NonD family hydrolase n=1 Tax=Chryseobacterium indicum TaxID=2766954 RepID=A0ABS9CBH0_9FLAO|nr:CocE/NonD family hydrolase [Chryseobacterium sp. PS-8]MCF2221039.1 CocE/NonD family hydrolase [Chryseobacterium sp. PS-8]